jgi:NADPH2:quinone reductase
MHAIRISEHGGPSVLRWEELPQPTPPDDGILVRVEAAGVNYIDTYHRRGIYEVPLPMTPGLEGAGVVVAAGGSQDRFAEGDRVAWSMAPGSYAELQVMPADLAVAVPDGLDTETAAALLLQGMTAHYLAYDVYPLGPEDRCLVHAGAGGVGLLLIQIAKSLGAEVFSTVSTGEKAALAAGAGADHVILYSEEDFGDAVERIAGERPLDVIYDGVGAATFDRGLELLRRRGTMALFGQSSGVVPPFDLGRLATNGSLSVTRPTLGDFVAGRDALEARAGAVLDMAAEGRLAVRIGHRWRIAEAAEAHRALEARLTTGKLLLTPG